MQSSYFITAIGTPLTDDELLCEEGLEQELADQKAKGFDGILVAGSMGCMPLLRNETWCRLIERSIELFDGEIIVGASECGYGRTADRIEYINRFKVDGVAILAPYFWKLSQVELVSYYQSLADVSRAPIYMYDLPQVVGTKLSLDTCIELSRHPNIAGAKLSGPPDFARQLIDAVGDRFRVVIAQPDLVDMLIKCGLKNHLDGIWTITPGWAQQIRMAAENNDWEQAAIYTQKMSAVRRLLPKYGRGCITDIMNARGIEGTFVGQPFKRLDAGKKQELLNEPIMQELIAEDHI